MQKSTTVFIEGNALEVLPGESVADAMGRAFSRVHFSSKTDLHATPQDFFDKLDAEFNFELDVCASPENAKCARYFTKEQDGLAQEWRGVVFMNPPYGRDIKLWIRKAFESSLAGATVVCLLPARTDTAYWHDYVMKADEIRFIRGRLKFGDSKNVAPFPSAVAIFKGAIS
jgi:site-specific DNA-methyltransferase (adenine-specific)